MKRTIVNTKEEPATINDFSPLYEFPHGAKVALNELIAAVNYLLEKEREQEL